MALFMIAWVLQDRALLGNVTAFSLFFFAAFYAGLRLLAYRNAAGQFVSFESIVTVTVFLGYGLLPALLVSAFGNGLFVLSSFTNGRWLGLPRKTYRQASADGLVYLAADGLAVVIGGLFYQAMGGSMPLQFIDLEQSALYATLFIAQAVVYNLILSQDAINNDPAVDRQQASKLLPRTALIHILSLTLSLLIVAALFGGRPGTLIISIFIVLLGATAYRLAELTSRALERRIAELSTLNSIGQAMTANLNLNVLLQTIHDQVRRLMRFESFYIALYDPIRREVTFPWVSEKGRRVVWQTRRGEYGLTEYIASHQKPILLSGPADALDARLDELGIGKYGAPAASYIGVPLIADREVIGVLSVQHDSDPDAYTQADVDLLITIAAQAAIALRNANLYQDVYQMAHQLALLNNVSSLVTASLDLHDVLETVGKVMIEFSGADKLGIFLADEEGISLRLAYAYGLGEDYIAQFQEVLFTDESRPGTSAASGPVQVLRQRELMAISDVQTDPRGLGWRTLAEVEGYVGLLTVPLAVSENTIGFMAAFYKQAHTFVPNELEIMETLANQVAITVANARLHEHTEARAREMERLVESSRAFTDSLDLPGVVGRVFAELENLLQPDMMTLRRLESDGTLRLLAQRGFDSAPERIMPFGAGAAALETARPVTLPLTAEDRESLLQMQLQGGFVFPLVSQGRSFGLVMLAHKAGRHMTSRERQLAEAMINQAAIALRNAQTFSAVDAELAERVEQLQAIEQISRKISGSLDLETIISDVLDASISATDADVAHFVLADSQTDRVIAVQRHRTPDGPITTHYVRDSKVGIVGRVLRTGKAELIADTLEDPAYIETPLGTMCSELCVPIIHDGRTVGALNIECHAPGAFTGDDERFLVNIADHAAIAIGNAQLFEERRQQIDTLTRLRDLSVDLLSAMSLRQVSAVVVEAALHITRAKEAYLYLYDASTDSLNFSASVRNNGQRDHDASPPRREGRAWQVARTGVRQIHTGMQPDDGLVARIPLKRGDQVRGVLVIVFDAQLILSDNHLRALDLIAGQAAIAIENARLFEEVRAGRDRMQVVFDSARDGMLLIDATGTLALANRAAEIMLDYPMQGAQGESVLEIAEGQPWESGMQSALTDIINNPDQLVRQLYKLEMPTKRDLEFTSLPVREQEGGSAGRLVVLRDVSQEEALKQFRKEVGDMVVHDLRSPLTGIIGSLRLMREMLEEGQYEELDAVIQISLTSGENLMRLIETLLDIAKLETGRMPLQQAANAPWQLAAQAVASLDAIAKQANVQVLNLVPADFSALYVDADQIYRVMYNLLDNALRHTPNGGQVRIEATMPDDEGAIPPMARISVTDTGRGIPREARHRIFNKFEQVPNSAVRGHRGIGLGLTFCRLTVEAHGGTIWVDSGPEGGVAFLFTLPLVVEPETETNSRD